MTICLTEIIVLIKHKMTQTFNENTVQCMINVPHLSEAFSEYETRK